MLRIWGRRNSANVQKVLWLVDELGLAYEHVPAGGSFGRLDEPAFGALNPNRMIPVIEDDGQVVWESHAILRYLAAAHAHEAYWPKDPFERSLADRWMDWCATAWQPAFLGGVFWGFYRTPEAERDEPAIRRSIELCSQLMGLLDRQLAAHPYLAGDHLSLADIPIGASLYRYFELDIERPPLPHVEAWYARLQARPAYRQNVMLPFDELKGRLAF